MSGEPLAQTMASAEVVGAPAEVESTVVINPTYAKLRQVPVPVEAHLEYKGERGENLFPKAYSGVTTRPVPLEERNVYCGMHHMSRLLEADNKSRVAAYSGGALLAVSCCDGDNVDLMNIYSAEVRSFIRGHCGRIRALVLCKKRGLLISASSNHCIVCWDLRTGAFLQVFSGHVDVVTCVDLHDDTLVSGSKDCQVKVWSLRKRSFRHLKFPHPGPVSCVKVVRKLVISSCNRLVRMWNVERASLLKVIDGHHSTVRCLFMDSHHILTGDRDGNVKAWSTSTYVKSCLKSFVRHPGEVSSVMLSYLRAITGCADGNIRIFCLLTGCCISTIKTGSPVLSVHAVGNEMVVNTWSSVQLYEFEEIQWAYFATNNAFILDIPGESFIQSIMKSGAPGKGHGTWHHPLPGFTAPCTLDIYSSYLKKPFPRLAEWPPLFGIAPVSKRVELECHMLPLWQQSQEQPQTEPVRLRCRGSAQASLPPLMRPAPRHLPGSSDRGGDNMHLGSDPERILPDLKAGMLAPVTGAPRTQRPPLRQIRGERGPEAVPICYGTHQMPLPPLARPAASSPPDPDMPPFSFRPSFHVHQCAPSFLSPFRKQQTKHVHFSKPRSPAGTVCIRHALSKGVELPEADRRERVKGSLLTGEPTKAARQAQDKQRNMLWSLKMKGVPITHLLDLDRVPAPELGRDTYI